MHHLGLEELTDVGTDRKSITQEGWGDLRRMEEELHEGQEDGRRMAGASWLVGGLERQATVIKPEPGEMS